MKKMLLLVALINSETYSCWRKTFLINLKNVLNATNKKKLLKENIILALPISGVLLTGYCLIQDAKQESTNSETRAKKNPWINIHL